MANQPHRNITVAQTYTPPKLDGGILQPAAGFSMATATGGGVLQNEVGPVRHRQSRPASERPSPVAFDGK